MVKGAKIMNIKEKMITNPSRKKILKRIIPVTVVLLITLLFSACSSSFTLIGKWKNTGTDTFGQIQENSVLIVDETYCNLYSPKDTYAFYKENGGYKLDISSYFFGESLSFSVNVIDNNHIEISRGNIVLSLTRVN